MMSQGYRFSNVFKFDPDHADFRMEDYLFRLLCLAAGLVPLFVSIPVDFLTHNSADLFLSEFLFAIFSLLLFSESLNGRNHTVGLYILTITNLSITWFSNGGSLGGGSYYFIPVIIYPFIYFRGNSRWWLMCTSVACEVGLLILEHVFPNWLVSYENEGQRLVELVAGIGISSLSSALMLWAVFDSCGREHRRLKIVEQSLNGTQMLLSAIIESSSDGIYAKDLEGRYILFNSGAAHISGRSAAQALGKDDTALFPCDDALRIMEMDREVVSSGRVMHEHQLTSADGKRIVVQTKKELLRDDKGNILGLVGVSRDVTEERHAKDEVLRLNSELELRVTERTAQLTAAMRESEAFSYSVSHDLRAPLRAINCYSAILEEECDPSPEVQGYLGRIRSSSRRMGELIDALLNLSHVGRSELQKKTVDLSELTRAISNRLQESAADRCVEFVVAPNMVVHGDLFLLRQMLENLLDNAWKYTKPREHARIELGMDHIGDKAVGFVRDNGVGFDMACKDKLFGAFQRLHGAEFEGTGIGLATAKRIVERHGGTIWAEAAVNEGTTVYFTLHWGTASD